MVIHYDGYGDSGPTEHATYEPEGREVPEKFDHALRDLAENYLPAGFENEEGGYGTLIVYPFDGLAELEHQDRYQATEDMDVAGVTAATPIASATAPAGCHASAGCALTAMATPA